MFFFGIRKTRQALRSVIPRTLYALCALRIKNKTNVATMTLLASLEPSHNIFEEVNVQRRLHGTLCFNS